MLVLAFQTPGFHGTCGRAEVFPTSEAITGRVVVPSGGNRRPGLADRLEAMSPSLMAF
jgi:hypothetical protein